MKVVFIGAGRIVRWFLDDIKNTKYANSIIAYGIYNKTIAKAVDYAKIYHIAKVYDNLENVIADKENYNLVYIGTSDASHYEIVKLFLLARVNVYCEKPLTIGYEKALELYDLAKKNNVLLFDGIKTGFSPAYQAMKNDLDNNIIGQVQYLQASHAKVSTSGKIPNPAKDDKNFVGLHLAGGMYALFIGIDVMGPIKQVAHLNNQYNNIHPAISTSVLNIRHQNNGISTIIASDQVSSDLSAMLLGTKGYIKLGGNLSKYNQAYKKDSCHMAYTYEVYDLQGNLVKKFDHPIKTDGEGLCLVIEHIYELVTKHLIESSVVNREISLAILKTLELTNNINDKEIIEY